MRESDFLQIILSHDLWATAQLLDTGEKLPADQLHRRFDIGSGSLHDTLTHVYPGPPPYRPGRRVGGRRGGGGAAGRAVSSSPMRRLLRCRPCPSFSAACVALLAATALLVGRSEVRRPRNVEVSPGHLASIQSAGDAVTWDGRRVVVRGYASRVLSRRPGGYGIADSLWMNQLSGPSLPVVPAARDALPFVRAPIAVSGTLHARPSSDGSASLFLAADSVGTHYESPWPGYLYRTALLLPIVGPPVGLLLVAGRSLRRRRACRWHPPGTCRRCGYSLVGNLSGRCPECGAVPPGKEAAP